MFARRLFVSGGTFTGRDAIRAGSNSTVDISNGTAGDGNTAFGLVAQDTSTVNITGGSFQGLSDAIYAQDSAIINIYGSGLAFSGGSIVGTLQSGQSIDTTYQTEDSSVINLINTAIPEPGTLSLLSLGLVPLALRRVRRCR